MSGLERSSPCLLLCERGVTLCMYVGMYNSSVILFCCLLFVRNKDDIFKYPEEFDRRPQ